MKHWQEFVQSASEVITQNKATVGTIIFGILTSLANLIDAVPSQMIGKLGGIMTIVVAFLLAINHVKNGKKSDLEHELLKMQIKEKEEAIEAAREKRRRKEDQKGDL